MRCPTVLGAALALATAAGPLEAQQPGAPVGDAVREAPASRPGDWLSHGRDYAETRFSPLDRIDSENVARLGLAWYYDTESHRGLEATPLVADGVLYAATSWSNVFAVDARTGRKLWRWDSEADRERGARACCDVVNRGLAISEGKVFVGVIDERLVALDTGIIAPPVTHPVDGRQYVSVLAGWGGINSLLGSNPSDLYKPEGRLWTFVLDGEHDFEPQRGTSLPELTPIDYEATEQRLADGAYLYGRNCMVCHGAEAASGGAIADMRYADPATFESFATIVRDGAYVGFGMPAFDEWLDSSDVAAIRAYVLSRRAALLAEP